MDNTELHYLTYDPDAIWEQMMLNYIDAGGDVLYPGDEKYMLLKAVQANVVQIFAGVDNALRMMTIRYAVGEYLDILGEQRGCPRIQATPARASVTITCGATGQEKTLPAGTAMTADGTVFYLLENDLTLSGYAQTVTVGVVAQEPGTAGNGLTAGTELSLAVSVSGVNEIIAATDASGGGDEETDEAYRERIRQYGLASVSTGPARQYEAAAEAVSSAIMDAKAVNEGAGQVGVYLILTDPSEAAAIIADVTAALSAEDVRPLTDTVSVQLATDVTYTLNVEYRTDGTTAVGDAITQAVSDYQAWQDNTIGQAFNPDRLMAALYQAGATRVIWGAGSTFDGGAVVYTEISSTQRCKGTITLTAI